MINIFALIALFCFIAASATPFVERTAGQIETDIAVVAINLNELIDKLTMFEKTDALSDALHIHEAAEDLRGSIITATGAVEETGPVTVPEANTIISRVIALEPGIYAALDSIIACKSNFEALPLKSVVILAKNDLLALYNSTLGFAIATSNSCPASLKAKADSVKDNINSKFIIAISVYSDVAV